MADLIDNTIKAEWTNADALDLQQTCNLASNDCISRQATIDEIEERKNANGYRNVAVISELNRLEGYIMRLPSAQPVDKDIDVPSTDTISRQDAIRIVDGIDTWQAGWRGNAIESIKALPSEQPEIVACGDCKHWICHDRRCGLWNHGVKPLDWCSRAERKEGEANEL